MPTLCMGGGGRQAIDRSGGGWQYTETLHRKSNVRGSPYSWIGSMDRQISSLL